MFRRINLSAIALMAIGGLLGYAVASGNLNPAIWFSTAQASSNSTSAQGTAAQEQLAGCCDGVNKDQMVALATHNRNVEANAQTSGKKPNICIIWGDDIGQSNVSAYSHGVDRKSHV